MKASQKCVKCDSRRILIVDEMKQPAEGLSKTRALCTTAAFVMMEGRRKEFGLLQAYVCEECGYCELYVSDVAELDELVGVANSGVRRQDSSSGPFR
jgi:predicted nucleic-acid-binding Zn-ribbon protein